MSALRARTDERTSRLDPGIIGGGEQGSGGDHATQAVRHDEQRRINFRHRIRHFTPSWFSVCMGTGAISQILHNFPYGSQRVLQYWALAFLILDAILFVVFTAMTIARYILYPQIWKMMIRDPVQSAFIGCFPMAFTTIISGAINASQSFNIAGPTYIYFWWGAWWADQAMSFACCFCMLYYMITRQEHALDSMLATWLLPVVPLVVCATTGAIVARALIPVSTQHALLGVTVSTISLMTGLSLSFMIINIYLLKLVVYKLPPKGFIVSKFLPLGPLGQGGTAFLLIAENLDVLSKSSSLPGPFFSDPLAGPIIKFIGMTLALFLWSNGIFWSFLATVSILEVFTRNKVPFGVPFWGMTFPIGVFVLLNLQLGVTLDSTFFRVFGVICGVALFVLWTLISVRTIIMTIEGSMFHAPCLDDSPLQVSPELRELGNGIAS